MSGNNGYTRIVAALLFVTVCAYLGAALWRHSGGDVSVMTAQLTTLTDTVRLDGIAVRTEQSFSCDAENGERLPASDASPSGVYFTECDGYEYLSPDALDDMPSLLAATPVKHTGGRLVTDGVWYYAAYCDAPLDAGRSYDVLFDGTEYPVRARLVSCDGQYALLRLSVGGDLFLSLRKCSAELTAASYSGVKLPADAVHTDADGNNFVYTCVSCVVRRKNVDIIYSDGKYCLVTGIDAGEQMITAGREIKEGTVIG